ncbi:MAG: SEL1-like repeat protein [Methanospirillum sp.]
MMLLSMGVGLVRTMMQNPAQVGGDPTQFGVTDAFAGALGGLSQCIYPMILTQNQGPLEEKRQAFQREMEARRLDADLLRFERTRDLQLELARLSHEHRLAEQQAHYTSQLAMRDWEHFYQHSWPLVVSPMMFRSEPAAGDGSIGEPARIPLRVFISNAKQSEYRGQIEERVVQGLYDFVSRYYPGSGPRPVTFYDGGWRETHKHGGAFIQALNRVLKGQPTLVIDPMVEGSGEYLTLRASFWGLGEMGIPFEKSVFRLPLAGMLRETAREYARRWKTIRGTHRLSETINPVDAANLKTLEVEETLRAQGLAPAEVEEMPFVRAGYKFDPRHYAAVADAVLIFHELVVGWVADAYYLAEHGLPPALPEIAPALLQGDPGPDLTEILLSGFRQLYGSLEARYRALLEDPSAGGEICIPRWCVLPELDLAYARSFAGLRATSMAEERLRHSVETWFALRNGRGTTNPEDTHGIADLAIPSDLQYFTALREAYGLLKDEGGVARIDDVLNDLSDAGFQSRRGDRLRAGTGARRDPTAAASWYRMAADQGHAGAQYSLGDLYRRGEGVERDAVAAAALFRMAAFQGDARAQYCLGELCCRGEGVKQDEGLAAEWFRKAAEQGYAPAQAGLAKLYCEGRGVEQDDGAAAALYRKAAAQGDAPAQYSLGQLYRKGRGMEQDRVLAIEWLRRAAEQGHAGAQAALGLLYYEGLSGEPDFPAAAEWWRRAADQGSARAQHNLGVLFRMGQGVEQDYRTALKWCRLAADQEYAPAQAALGGCYHDGLGVETDYRVAAEWFRKAADQDYALAQHVLAGMYHHGYGVEQDYGRAADLFRKAADQGYAAAQNDLAGMYFFGQGVELDYTLAREWFGKAAEQGYVKAYFGLGEIYYYGYGVPEDRETAAQWYGRAEQEGHGGAMNRLKAILEARMREGS